MNRKQAVAAALILLAGFALRCYGFRFGLPYLYHADEPIVVNHALAYANGDLNPHFFKIPPLLSYMLFLVYGLFFAAARLTGFISGPLAFEHFFYSDPSLFYILARFIFGVFAGTLTLWVFLKALIRHYPPKVSLTAAFLLSVCFLHVRDSHYVYADIPLVLVMTGAFGAFLNLYEKQDMRRHIIAGCFIGLAAALKYNGAVLAVPYLAASLLSLKRPAFRHWLAAAGVSILVFFCLNPYALLDHAFFLQELRAQTAAQGGTPWFHPLTYSLAGGLGWTLLLVSVCGLLYSICTRQKRDLVFSAFVLAYYLVLVKAGQPYDRYVLPLLPPLILLASRFWVTASDKLPLSRFVFWIGMVILIAAPLTKSVLFGRIMAKPDVRTLTKQWVENNIPPGNTFVLDWDFYMPRLNFSKRQLLDKKKENFSAPGTFSGAQIRRLDWLIDRADTVKGQDLYFLAEDPQQPRFLFARPVLPYQFDALPENRDVYVIRLGWPEKPGARTFYEEIRKRGKLIASFSPYRESTRFLPYDPVTMTAGPFLWEELKSRERNGLALEIYKIRR